MFVSSSPPVVIYVVSICLRVVMSDTCCVIVLCSMCHVLPISLDSSYWLPLQYSVTFICYNLFTSVPYRKTRMLDYYLYSSRLICVSHFMSLSSSFMSLGKKGVFKKILMLHFCSWKKLSEAGFVFINRLFCCCFFGKKIVSSWPMIQFCIKG